jgi:dihydrofolate reductase
MTAKADQADHATPRIALIVAVAENGVIGSKGDLPWRLSSDLKLFRKLTMGHPIVMGRKTFASLKKPLDGRDNIVVTRDEGFAPEGVILAHSVDQALALGRESAAKHGVDEVFIIGGAEIFRETLPLATRVYLTRVHASPEGDVVLPDLNPGEWQVLREVSYEKSPKDDHSFTFFVLGRNSQGSAAV